jgi:heat shock protein HslJ
VDALARTVCPRSLAGASALLAWLALGCAASKPHDAASSAATVAVSAPSPAEVMSASFRGIAEASGPVVLSGGRWQGAPAVAGSAMRPEVALAGRTDLAGDLDGDGVAEAVVFLSAATGGSGVGGYIGVVSRRKDGLLRTATAPVGDRVQVRDMRVAGGKIVLDVLQAGERDAMCCPGDLATRTWMFADTTLREGMPEPGGRLTLDVLRGTRWVLRRWDIDEAVPAAPQATLTYDAGRFSGNSGCNSFRAAVTAGTTPGELALGAIASTRMLCPGSAMGVENRYLKALAGARKFGFLMGQLALSYEVEGKPGTLLFDRAP